MLLNLLYDGHDWQLQQAFRPAIRCVGQYFRVIAKVNLDGLAAAHIFLELHAPSPLEGDNEPTLTWHKVAEHNTVSRDGTVLEINVNLGRFGKCGFYDWRMVCQTPSGMMQPL